MTWEKELISRRKWSQVRGALPRKRGQQRTSPSPWPRPVNGVAQPGQPKATREATGTAGQELHKAGTRTPRRSQQSRHRSAQRHARDHAKRPRRAQPRTNAGAEGGGSERCRAHTLGEQQSGREVRAGTTCPIRLRWTRIYIERLGYMCNCQRSAQEDDEEDLLTWCSSASQC